MGETDAQISLHNRIFTSALWTLFVTLSSWETAAGATFGDKKKGVTLELSAHSPSDFEHWCGELANRADDTAWCLHDAKVSGNPGWDIHGGKLVLKLFLMGSTEMSPIDLV